MENEIIYPPLALKFYNDAYQIGKRIAELFLSYRERIRELRHELEDKIKRVDDVDETYSCIAIDSSYTTSLISLVSVALGAVAYGYYKFPQDEKEISGEVFEYKGAGESIHHNLSHYARSKERVVAINYLLKHNDIDGVVFDGDFPPFPIPFKLVNHINVGFSKIRFREEVARLYSLINERRVWCLGVVKRIRFPILSTLFNMDVEEKIIASLLLEPNEYIILGEYGKIVPEVFSRNSRFSLAEWERISREMPEVSKTKVIYFKPSRSRSQMAIKLLYYGEEPIEKIVGFLNKYTNWTGYPIFLDIIDRLVSVDLKTYKNIIWESFVKGLGDKLVVRTEKGKVHLYLPEDLQKYRSIM